MKTIPSNHPSAEMLAAYRGGGLEPDQRTIIEQHLSQCEVCGPNQGNATSEAPVTSNWSSCPQALIDHPRYRVLRLLGSGGMGTVFLAEHKLMRRLVALKVLREAAFTGAEARERFLREVEAVARVSHAAIVTAYDAEQVGDLHLLVMEYVEGIDLDDLVDKEGPLAIDRACDYIRQAAEGLQHAHEHGLVHRDLKPSNLMCTLDGQIKILDFGLARLGSESVRLKPLTQTGICMGTPDYIAPEQVLDTAQADIRSDIYALGCTFYYLLSGRNPFEGNTISEKLVAHKMRAPLDVTVLRPDVPAAVRDVLGRMLAKDPQQRYQTPAEVVEALSGLLQRSDLAGTARVSVRRAGSSSERTLGRQNKIDGDGATERLTRDGGRSRKRRSGKGVRRGQPSAWSRIGWSAVGTLLVLAFLLGLWAFFPPIWYLLPPPPWEDQRRREQREGRWEFEPPNGRPGPDGRKGPAPKHRPPPPEHRPPPDGGPGDR